jgi:hypothetical protein
VIAVRQWWEVGYGVGFCCALSYIRICLKLEKRASERERESERARERERERERGREGEREYLFREVTLRHLGVS